MKSGFLSTSQYFKNTGTIWFILGLFVSIIGDLELSTFIFKDSNHFWYGKLKPFYSNIMIFGALISYFLSVVYLEIENIKTSLLKPTIISKIVFGIYQFALIFGLFTILYSKSEGRIYGELNFITDNLFLLVFTVVLVKLIVYIKNSGTFTYSHQFLIILITGMILTFFLGNFGFPNSYITTVPPTSGFQDAMISEFYKNSILIFFILLPSLYLIYFSLKNVYNLNDQFNFFNILISIIILIPFTSGSGLSNSPYQNFWTDIGSYILIGILFLILGIAYYLHLVYNQNKSKEPIFIFSVSGILFLSFMILLIISKLPILEKYFQFTVMDTSDYSQKIIFMILPIFLVYNHSFYNDKKISNSIVILLLVIGLLAYIIYFLDGALMSRAQFALNDKGELLIKEWSTILDKNKIFLNLRIILQVIIFFLSFYLVKYPLENKIIQGENQ